MWQLMHVLTSHRCAAPQLSAAVSSGGLLACSCTSSMRTARCSCCLRGRTTATRRGARAAGPATEHGTCWVRLLLVNVDLIHTLLILHLLIITC